MIEAIPSDPFERLGLAPSFAWGAVADEAVERAYRAQSRRFHPDRHAGAGARERRLALEWTTALNEARRVLRDPLSRAEVLLASLDPTLAQHRPSMEFLEQVMERRQALADARARGALGTPGTQGSVEALALEVEREREQALRRFASAYEELRHGGGGAAASPALLQAREALCALRYHQRFLAEVETGALEALERGE